MPRTRANLERGVVQNDPRKCNYCGEYSRMECGVCHTDMLCGACDYAHFSTCEELEREVRIRVGPNRVYRTQQTQPISRSVLEGLAHPRPGRETQLTGIDSTAQQLLDDLLSEPTPVRDVNRVLYRNVPPPDAPIIIQPAAQRPEPSPAPDPDTYYEYDDYEDAD